MTPLDWGILGFAALLAIWGYAQGVIVGSLVLAGFGGGAALGARVAPALLHSGSESPYSPLFALIGASIIGATTAFVFEGIGSVLRRLVSRGPFVALDALGGALLAGALGLAIAWVLGAVAAQTLQLSNLRRAVQKSAVLRELNDRLPPSGSILKALARFDPLPQIRGPRADVSRPNRRILAQPEVKKAAPSVVRVLGTACGLGVQGSGWVAAPQLVVTNAHVVAGQKGSVVQIGTDGPKAPAIAAYFDAKNDLAVLRVPGLSSPSLRLAQEARSGESVAILGYPENGPFDARAGRLGTTNTVLSQDAYGGGPVQRSITAFRGLVRHGNSGGPAVDSSGLVATTVFAASQSGGGGFGVSDDVVAKALSESRGQHIVSTGPCAS